jgi:hypothetical protein
MLNRLIYLFLYCGNVLTRQAVRVVSERGNRTYRSSTDFVHRVKPFMALLITFKERKHKRTAFPLSTDAGLSLYHAAGLSEFIVYQFALAVRNS